MSADYDGLDDDGDDEQTVPSPSIIAERTRSSCARRIAAVRLLVSGRGSLGDLGAAYTDVGREAVVGTELGWAEHIKEQYNSTISATEVMRAWRRFWMRFSKWRASWHRRKSATCNFEAGRGALAPVGTSGWTMTPRCAVDRRRRACAGDAQRRQVSFVTTTDRAV